MPVFKSGSGQAPRWAEMEFFEILELPAGASQTLKRRSPKEKLFVGEGYCRISRGKAETTARRGDFFEISSPEGKFRLEAAFLTGDAHLVGRALGRGNRQLRGFHSG